VRAKLEVYKRETCTNYVVMMMPLAACRRRMRTSKWRVRK
jgi:hypothetical protein